MFADISEIYVVGTKLVFEVDVEGRVYSIEVEERGACRFTGHAANDRHAAAAAEAVNAYTSEGGPEVDALFAELARNRSAKP